MVAPVSVSVSVSSPRYTMPPRRSFALLALVAAIAAEQVTVDPKGASHGERFTDTLAAENGDLWHSVVHHRFTDEIAAGTLSLDVLRCYLIQDHRFLDAFVVLLSSMIAAARALPDRIPGAQFLALITGKENTYFERSFSALGVSDSDRELTPNATATTRFIELMRQAARSGSLAEMLAVLVVAEWSYQSWGERVLPAAVAEPFYFREWVDLHSGAYFGSVVEYLRALLDREASLIDDAGRSAVRARFAEAAELEKAFFDHCYSK